MVTIGMNYKMIPGKEKIFEDAFTAVLGVMEEMEFESATFTISKGDSIFLYTDGVNEAMNEADEEYSYERLEDYLKENSTGSITDMVDRNLESVKEFAGTAPQSDDITVLALRYLGE